MTRIGQHQRLISKILHRETRQSYIDPTTYTLTEDADRLEGCFPGCTVAIDANQRMASWLGHRVTIDFHGNHGKAEDGQAALLVALRTDEHGAYVQTKTKNPVRMGARYFVERAIYVPSCERWVVIR